MNERKFKWRERGRDELTSQIHPTPAWGEHPMASAIYFGFNKKRNLKSFGFCGSDFEAFTGTKSWAVIIKTEMQMTTGCEWSSRSAHPN
jgi:hypothetical protein